MRFTIYNVYDDQIGGCEYSLVWDNDFRFTPKLSKFGNVMCLDFDRSCTTCITGSSTGWIIIWDIAEERLLRKFRNIDPEKTQVPRPKVLLPCYIIKTMIGNKLAFTYDVVSGTLLMHRTKINQRELL